MLPNVGACDASLRELERARLCGVERDDIRSYVLVHPIGETGDEPPHILTRMCLFKSSKIQTTMIDSFAELAFDEGYDSVLFDDKINLMACLLAPEVQGATAVGKVEIFKDLGENKVLPDSSREGVDTPRTNFVNPQKVAE